MVRAQTAEWSAALRSILENIVNTELRAISVELQNIPFTYRNLYSSMP